MFKKIILTLSVLFLSLISNLSYADSIPVETVFLDINKDYKYYNELQTLYDKGMIEPDENGNFNPNEFLNRDEFVGIMMESTCRECIKPDVSLEYQEKYSDTELFFDLGQENKYFYCAAGAKDNGYVKGYHEGSTCEDGSFKEGEIPFCPNNTIILEEAIAIILRASGIMTQSEADLELQKIISGEITADLSDDVSPKNPDGSVYSFYPYLKKALEYQVREVDTNGNEKVYTLLKIEDGKIYPKTKITKEKFLEIAYITFKANSCQENRKGNIAVGIDLNNYSGIYSGTCEKGVDESGYIWRFFNLETGKEIKKYGKDLGNFNFLAEGEYKVYLRVIDNCGLSGETWVNYIVGDTDFYVNLDANPIFGKSSLNVDFKSRVYGGVAPFEYYWDFGDGNKSIGKNTENIFKLEGNYITNLKVIDSTGKQLDANVLINVIDSNLCTKDSDFDGINDCDDLCPLISGNDKNEGCPINEQKCSVNTECNFGFECSELGVCLPVKLENNCEYSGGNLIFGNAICNSCPCDNYMDFNSVLRKCDVIFPAITSPDQSEIYRKGEFYQIK